MKWFTEYWTDHVKFSIRIKKLVYSKETEYQKLEIYDSYEFGRFMTLDGYMMVNEKDEFIYHEMIVHVPMNVKPDIKNVLVIGGGDGGTVRELLRYPDIESIDMVEIDEEVVRACQEFLPQTAHKLNDPKVNLIFTDGIEYVASTEKTYDLIIVDSTDPIGPGTSLFKNQFYKDCYRILMDDGILVNQHESPYFDDTRSDMKKINKKLTAIFPFATVYQAFIPTYPSGHWLFGFASKKLTPEFRGNEDLLASFKLQYYNQEVHRASFALPNYVKEELR